MRIHLMLMTATLALVPPLASAEDAAADRRDDHPAVVVQRLHAVRAYDYASKFYPHPAKLYLLREAPRPPADPDAAARPRDADALAQGVPVARRPSHDAATE